MDSTPGHERLQANKNLKPLAQEIIGKVAASLRSCQKKIRSELSLHAYQTAMLNPLLPCQREAKHLEKPMLFSSTGIYLRNLQIKEVTLQHIMNVKCTFLVKEVLFNLNGNPINLQEVLRKKLKDSKCSSQFENISPAEPRVMNFTVTLEGLCLAFELISMPNASRLDQYQDRTYFPDRIFNFDGVFMCFHCEECFRYSDLNTPLKRPTHLKSLDLIWDHPEGRLRMLQQDPCRILSLIECSRVCNMSIDEQLESWLQANSGQIIDLAVTGGGEDNQKLTKLQQAYRRAAESTSWHKTFELIIRCRAFPTLSPCMRISTLNMQARLSKIIECEDAARKQTSPESQIWQGRLIGLAGCIIGRYLKFNQAYDTFRKLLLAFLGEDALDYVCNNLFGQGKDKYWQHLLWTAAGSDTNLSELFVHDLPNESTDITKSQFNPPHFITQDSFDSMNSDFHTFFNHPSNADNSKSLKSTSVKNSSTPGFLTPQLLNMFHEDSYK